MRWHRLHHLRRAARPGCCGPAPGPRTLAAAAARASPRQARPACMSLEVRVADQVGYQEGHTLRWPRGVSPASQTSAWLCHQSLQAVRACSGESRLMGSRLRLESKRFDDCVQPSCSARAACAPAALASLSVLRPGPAAGSGCGPRAAAATHCAAQDWPGQSRSLHKGRTGRTGLSDCLPQRRWAIESDEHDLCNQRLACWSCPWHP